MRVLDLFSGIGGFSLGLERSGMETIAFCEIEDYPVKILNKHWPDVPVFRDIRKLTKEVLLNEVSNVPEIIVGGFPCQPFSVAGKQRGKEDDRHLWPEMFRLIKEIRPRWVVGENVAGFIRMALDDVLSDLEGEGYRCQTFIIPACAVNATHRRDRVWIVAHTEYSRWDATKDRQSHTQRDDSNTSRKEAIKQSKGRCCSPDETQIIANSKIGRCKQSSVTGETERQEYEFREKYKPDDVFTNRYKFKYIPIPTKSPVRLRNDGISDNVARLKALGNAVVPQIPEIIGRAIMEIETNMNKIKGLL